MPANIHIKLKIIQDQVSSCIKCDLSKTRTNTVFSRGNPLSRLLVLGEGPGQEEDAQGLPFVGKSGQLLDQAISEVGLNPKEDIYVCNIIKCRPPNNRTPTEDETNNCINYLQSQINIINPKVIIAFGNTAFHNLINSELGIMKAHGKIFNYYAGPNDKKIVVPVYHPSFILRNGGSGSLKYKELIEDLNFIKGLI